MDVPFTEEPIRGLVPDHLDPDELEARYILDECVACGLVYQRHAPGDELLRRVYENPALSSHAVEEARGLEVRRNYASQVEQLLKFFERPAHQVNVLDFGAGFGMWLRMARAYGCRPYGSDLVESRHEGAEWETLSIDELPAQHFDFINTEQVFEHLVHPRAVLTELVRALRPNGILRLSVPNGSDILERLAKGNWSAPKGAPESLNAVAPLEHLNCFNHASLKRMATGAGLELFNYPLRQYIDQWERFRFIGSAFVHVMRRPQGTMLLFRKPG